MPEYKYYEDYEIGEKQVTSSRTMTEADIRLFIGCSDNTHPVHVDEEYCKRHPAIKGCIVQNEQFGVVTWNVNVVNQNNEVVLFHIDKQYIGRRPADKKE